MKTCIKFVELERVNCACGHSKDTNDMIEKMESEGYSFISMQFEKVDRICAISDTIEEAYKATMIVLTFQKF